MIEYPVATTISELEQKEQAIPAVEFEEYALLNKWLRWREDPVAYAEERLHVTMWPELSAILISVRDNFETAVQSGNAVGKTFTAAIILLWYLETHAPCKIITTGSSWRVLKEHLWPYVHTLARKNSLFIQGGSRKKYANDMSIKLGEDRTAYAVSTDKPEGIMGGHSENILQLVEESSGIDQEIANAIQGNAKGKGSRILWMGNPLKPSGPFYEKCRNGRIHTIKISAFDHPNVKTGTEVISGAVTRKDIETDAEEWCTPCAPHTPGSIHLPWRDIDGWYLPSPVFIARVLGEFPEIDLDALIDRVKLRGTCGRTPKDNTPTVMGIDVARSTAGDETVIAIGNASGVLELVAMRINDLVKITAKILELLQANPTISRVAVDAIGIGGGIVDNLRANGIEVLAVNVAEPAMEKEDYFLNLKAQIYWEFKDRIEKDDTFFLPDDQRMREQIEFLQPAFGMSGHHVKVKIEDKDKYKKRTGYSPDRAEACILMCYMAKFAVSMFIPNVYLAESFDYEEEQEISNGGMFR